MNIYIYIDKTEYYHPNKTFFFLLALSVMSEFIQRYTTNSFYLLLSVHLGILTLTINGDLCVKNKQTTQNTGFFGVFF